MWRLEDFQALKEAYECYAALGLWQPTCFNFSK